MTIKQIEKNKETNLLIERCFKILMKLNMDITNICFDVVKGAEKLAESDIPDMKSMLMQQGALELVKIISGVFVKCRIDFDKETEISKGLANGLFNG